MVLIVQGDLFEDALCAGLVSSHFTCKLMNPNQGVFSLSSITRIS